MQESQSLRGNQPTPAQPATRGRSQPRRIEHHRQVNSLRDVILGGQDGLVNILGIVLGVVAANGSTTVLLSAGFAAAITESISMGAVAYTSTLSERDYYESERARENREIDEVPDIERQEIREIYGAKGFQGDLLESIVETITADRETWLNTMMDEELHLQPVDRARVLRSSVIVTIATLIGHLIPLWPFAVMSRGPAVVVAIVISGLVLFGVGVYSALTLVGNWVRSGIQMLIIGLGAAALGFAIGLLFNASVP